MISVFSNSGHLEDFVSRSIFTHLRKLEAPVCLLERRYCPDSRLNNQKVINSQESTLMLTICINLVHGVCAEC